MGTFESIINTFTWCIDDDDAPGVPDEATPFSRDVSSFSIPTRMAEVSFFMRLACKNHYISFKKEMKVENQ